MISRGVKLIKTNKETIIFIGTRNYGLSVLYVLSAVFFSWFILNFHKGFDQILTLKGRYLLLFIVLILFILLILISVFGSSKVRINNSEIKLHSGIWDYGWNKTVQLVDLKKVFVRVYQYSGRCGADGVYSIIRSSDRFLVVRGKRDIKFLKNQIVKEDLEQVCKLIKLEISKRKTGSA